MGDRVQGKVAVVTGAASGMGAADVRILAEEGARVVAADVNRETLDRVVAELVSEGLAVSALTLDVTKQSDWAEAIAFAERTYGDVTILVNNAGIIHRAGIELTTPEIWDRTIDINQRGVMYGMQAVLPGMRRAGGGSIVNIASILGIVSSGSSTAYHASKGAVRSLSKQAAVELGPERIRVNSVDPGFIETAILTDLRAEGYEFESKTNSIPLRRFGDPREIAQAVLFFASDDSSYMTGTDLVVDGGMIAQGLYQ